MRNVRILSLALLLSACGTDTADRVARARSEIAGMELAAARVDLAAALAERGDDAELLRLLASVQLRLGEDRKSVV